MARQLVAFLADGFQPGDGLEILGAAGRTLDLDQLVEFQAAAGDAEQLDLKRVRAMSS